MKTQTKTQKKILELVNAYSVHGEIERLLKFAKRINCKKALLKHFSNCLEWTAIAINIICIKLTGHKFTSLHYVGNKINKLQLRLDAQYVNTQIELNKLRVTIK